MTLESSASPGGEEMMTLNDSRKCHPNSPGGDADLFVTSLPLGTSHSLLPLTVKSLQQLPLF